MLMDMSLCFFHLVLKQVNVVVDVIILTIHMQKFVSDIVKNLNIKVFNLMSRTNETRFIEWYETCNNKQSWNKNKCRCECKKLIDRGVCNKGFI